jgi:hypothetical protein
VTSLLPAQEVGAQSHGRVGLGGGHHLVATRRAMASGRADGLIPHGLLSLQRFPVCADRLSKGKSRCTRPAGGGLYVVSTGPIV